MRDETRQLVRRRFNVELLEGYGATEAAPVIAVNQPGHNRPGTVGRPLPGMEVKFEPVPGIEKGGRMPCGPNVMQGYLSASKPGELQKLPDGWHSRTARPCGTKLALAYFGDGSGGDKRRSTRF